MANIGAIATAKGEQFTNAHVASMSRHDLGIYVLSGCDVNQASTPGLSVVVDSGYISIGFGLARKTVVGRTITIATPDATYPRIDVIYVDPNGAASVYAGAPAAISPSTETDFKKMASPSPGSNIPSGAILALVYVAAGATEILNASILDIASYGGFVAEAPTSSTTSGYVPQWSSTQKTLTTGLAVGTSSNNLVQLTAAAKLPAVDGSLLTGRVFGIDFPFGNGQDVIEANQAHEFHVPISCKIIEARIQEVWLNSGSITCTLYVHLGGNEKGAVVDSFSIASAAYMWEVGLNIPVNSDNWIRIETSGITSMKQIVCSLVLEAT